MLSRIWKQHCLISNASLHDARVTVETGGKNVPTDKKGRIEWGDHYTWPRICADTKLMVSWMVGKRDYETTTVFMNDLA